MLFWQPVFTPNIALAGGRSIPKSSTWGFKYLKRPGISRTRSDLSVCRGMKQDCSRWASQGPDCPGPTLPHDVFLCAQQISKWSPVIPVLQMKGLMKSSSKIRGPGDFQRPSVLFKALGVGDGQGSLACCSLRVTKSQRQLRGWTDGTETILILTQLKEWAPWRPGICL